MNKTPAFPRPYSEFECGGQISAFDAQTGMTLRDYFAAKAMTQIIASDPDCKMSFATVASLAYQSADAMLAERAK